MTADSAKVAVAIDAMMARLNAKKDKGVWNHRPFMCGRVGVRVCVRVYARVCDRVRKRKRETERNDRESAREGLAGAAL